MKAVQIMSYLYLSICLLCLISGMAAYEDSTRPDSLDRHRSKMETRRLFELSDEFFRECCRKYINISDCPKACNKFARHKAKDQLEMELKNLADYDPAPAFVNRVSLGKNRANFQIFKN